MTQERDDAVAPDDTTPEPPDDESEQDASLPEDVKTDPVVDEDVPVANTDYAPSQPQTEDNT